MVQYLNLIQRKTVLKCSNGKRVMFFDYLASFEVI